MKTLILTPLTDIRISSWLSELGNPQEVLLTIIFLVTMIVILIAAICIDRAVKTMYKLTFPAESLLVEKAKRDKPNLSARLEGIWTRILELKPIEQERDLVIDHEYDGIKELDNPIPNWFNVLFYSTVTFGLIYLLIYHVFGIGLLQDEEYKQEMAAAEIAKQEYLAQVANLIDENTITVDPTMITAGKAIFTSNCVACHGNAGEGGIGPNLTDKFWLHGGEIKDIFKTVKYGVPDKGMVPWEQTLTPGQIAEVCNYIVSIRDTKPGNAKAPEGMEFQYANESGNEEVAQ